MVLAREQQTGRLIAIRLSGPKEPKLRVTLSSIYRHFPELRPARVDDLVTMARQLSERAEARTKTVVHEIIAESIEPRLATLEKASSITERALRELSECFRPELPRTAPIRPAR